MAIPQTPQTPQTPQAELDARFAAALAAAFGDQFAATDPLIRPSQFGDVQANAAMSLAKTLRRPPPEVAAAIVDHLDLTGVGRAEVSGPGFINVTLDPAWIAQQAQAMLAATDGRLGVAQAATPDTVVVDYSAPNIAKEMHVGHLRTTIIGDALVRVLGFLGHRVLRQNHLGDWGTPFGMLIEHLLDVGEAAAAAQLASGDINAFYQAAHRKFDTDPQFAERARKRVVALQGGDPETLRLWQEFVADSARYINKVYRRLGVLLTDDDLYGESFYNDQLDDVVNDLEAKGLTVVSDGALCVFPPGFTGRDGQPLPMIVRKRDGGYGYVATDLATLRYSVQHHHASRLVYVVGNEQSLHFRMLFAVARMAGWLDEAHRAQHAATGFVLGTDGRLLRTRSGESIKLLDLLDEAVERAAAILADRAEIDPDERVGLAETVGIGAVKYADLSTARERDYVFDWDRMLAFDGNTGPYLQYAGTRIRSIFRRAGLDPASAEVTGAPIILGELPERALALRLLGFSEVVQSVADSLEPHRLSTWLYELATAFTDFYERCPVLQADDEAVRRSRLALSALTLRALTVGLGCLGIGMPERM
jgi:arginyl-tRNA synthetase